MKAEGTSIVLCEGRVSEAAGVKLLLASLARHAPEWDVLAYLSEPLFSRIGAACVRIHPRTLLRRYNGPEDWSCKPAVLMAALDEVPDRRVIWVDTDILVIGNLSSLARVPTQTLIVAEESNPNDNARVPLRQDKLGLARAAPRETTISSCVIGVTARHRPLLTRWQSLMSHDAFLAEQSLPPRQRRLFRGDQEVWELVLCEAEHRSVPLYWLTNDSQLVQANYTPYRRRPMLVGDERLFVHATGDLKPWRIGSRTCVD